MRRKMTARISACAAWFVQGCWAPVLVLVCGVMLGGQVTAQNAEAAKGVAATLVAVPDENAEAIAGVKERIAEMTKNLETLRATAPPDAKDLQELVGLGEQTLEMSQRHLQSLEMYKSTLERRALAEKSLKEWVSPTRKGPPSLLEADRYRAAYLAARDALRVAHTFKEIFTQTEQNLQAKLVAAESAVQRARENVNKVGDDAAKLAARASLQLEEARLRLIGVELESTRSQIRTTTLVIETEEMKSELATKQRLMLGDALVFEQEELDRIVAEITKKRDALSADRQRASRSTRMALNTRVSEMGLTARADILGWMVAIQDLSELMWRIRFAMVNATTAELRVKEREKLEELLARVPMWRLLIESRQRTLQSATTDLQAKMKANAETSGAEAKASDEALMAELAGLDSLLQEGIKFVEELVSKGEIWEVVGDGVGRKRGFKDWLAASRVWLTETAKTLWNLQLYAIEESVVVDGRTLSGERPITVGKVLQLALIVVLGYIVLRWFAVRVSRRAEKQFRLEAARANTVRRWLMGMGMAGLGLYALDYANIPLTAFAFLGGALAIGVGFGTQNIIKNFISGLIIQAEKPFQVGDVLEAGAINGTVVHIGMRSSVIRHWDGIETLIPNSGLLENNVTNWTYSDRNLRHSVRVGVAYGSDLRLVVDALTQSAEAHGLILKTPAPYVLFDDFADSSLVFSLYFWIDMSKAGRAQVASDLRFMIEKLFNEKGISMAFPQRDMHLITTEPIEVRMRHQS